MKTGKSKTKRDVKEKKVITKQVCFEESEWAIVEEAMKHEKITEVSAFIRRSVLLFIGKNIQQKMKL